MFSLLMLRRLILLLLFCSCQCASALVEEGFWLPASYQQWLPEMRAAAVSLEGTGDCVEVVRATLQENKSTREHPYFRLICRDKDNISYSVLADSLSGELIYTNPLRSAEVKAEMEARKIAEEKRKKSAAQQQKILDSEASCQSMFTEKTRFMRGQKWLTPRPQGPFAETPAEDAPSNQADAEVGQETEVFPIWYYQQDFDAMDLHGQPLHYRATCRVLNEGGVEVIIIPRSQANE